MTSVTHDLWQLTEGEGQLCAVAIHDGHELRPEVEERIALSEEARLREEDPFTGQWTALAPTRLVARRSRFEVDLNRPRAHAVYVRPEDAWGLRVWQDPPPPELVVASLAEYDAFYAEARRVLDHLVARHGRFVVFDLHTYNHRRAGPGAPYDAQSKHPDVNLGTGTMNRELWAPVIDRVRSELESCENLGRRLDVRENIKFKGGNFSRWVHETYPQTGCSIAIELKKFFMDEWSGQLYVDLHRSIGGLLKTVAAAALEELERLRAPGEPSAAAPVDYGRSLKGLWRCGHCGREWLPSQLRAKEQRPPFRCTGCDDPLTYTELP